MVEMKTNRCMDTSMFEANTAESMNMSMDMNMNTNMPNMMGCGCGCPSAPQMCPGRWFQKPARFLRNRPAGPFGRTADI